MKRRPGLIIALLAIAGVTLVWLSWDRDPSDQQQGLAQTDAAGADYWIDSPRVNVYNPEGIATYRLDANRLSHEQVGGRHLIDAPNMQLFSDTAQRWQVTARQATVDASGNRIDFQGDVRMTRESSGPVSNSPRATPDLQVSSETMAVFTEQGRLETDAPVVINTPSSETHSVGMRAFTETERLQLLSNVRSRQLTTRQ